MTLSKKFSTLLAGAVIALGLAACNGGADNQAASGGQPAAAGADTVAAIKEKGVIRIGVFGDKPPFGYVDANGKNQGFDVEIAKEMAKDLLGSPDKSGIRPHRSGQPRRIRPLRQSRPRSGQLHPNPRTRRSRRFRRPLHESRPRRRFPRQKNRLPTSPSSKTKPCWSTKAPPPTRFSAKTTPK